VKLDSSTSKFLAWKNPNNSSIKHFCLFVKEAGNLHCIASSYH
jgi:hypothetical protein